ncbi:hypothetical protein JCM3775_004508 [Rhodotorula graminis]
MPATELYHLCTPGCQIAIDSARLHHDRIRAIKCDPLVNRSQLYGSPPPPFIFHMFTRRYIESLVPACRSGGGTVGRTSYVFAVESRSEEVRPRPHAEAREHLDASGYIGNLGIDIECKSASLAPRVGEPFFYPSADDLEKAGAHASLYYELHPDFWGQGLMTELILAVLGFIFDTLLIPSVIVDPVSTNTASIRLAKRLGFALVGDKPCGGVPAAAATASSA